MFKKHFALIFFIGGMFMESHGQDINPTLKQPNILFIMVDDLRPELGCYGQSHIQSPNIDRLASMGQLFTQAYVNYPVCGPTRAILLSGLYGSPNRFNGWNCSQDKDVPGLVSLPMHFKNNHYTTVSLGKVYNNFEDGKGSWDEIWRPATSTTAWDYQSKDGISIFENLNRERRLDTRPRNNQNLPKRGLAFENPEIEDVAYEDGRIATKAMEKLQEFKVTGEAFFLAVGFKKPHLPFNAPKKYWDLYDKEEIHLPDNHYPPKNAPKESLHNFGELRAYSNIPNDGPFSEELSRDLIHGYYACVSYVDAQVGRVLEELENLGLEENTIVVLWGDHGWQLGEHELWCKHANFITSNRIPLIFKIPGKLSNVKQEALVETVDIYPTLCELAGLNPPLHVQGKSFVPLLDNPEAEGKKALFSRSNLGGETILTKTHSYTEFYDKEGQLKANMLFDLRNDPEENENVVDRPQNQEIIANMSEMLRNHMVDRNTISLP
ncbi:MAG: sulfatase [Cyclobacteriaceae bacterium]